MRTRYIVLPILLTCILVCAQAEERKKISYPYKASPQRETQILEGAPKINPDMKSIQVKAILGEPDEVMDLFRRSDVENKPRGYSYWYMIRREAPPQTKPRDPSQKLVWVCFDLKDRVTSVDYWGINNPSDDKLNEIEPPEIEGRGEWGEETLGLVCRITTDKTEYTIGDKVFILVEIKNNSDKPIALGLEPLIEVRGGNLTRQPASIGIGFSQRNGQDQLGFFCSGSFPFPSGTKSEAKAVSLAPGKIYSKIYARKPWGPSFGCIPSTAQPGKIDLKVIVSQFLAGDLKKKQVVANNLVLTVKSDTAMASNQSIPCSFIAEVFSIVPMKPGEKIKGYHVDEDSKWVVELNVLPHKRKIPFQPGIRRCSIADVEKVFGSPRENVAGTYKFTYTWNVRVPGKPPFENFKAWKIDVQDKSTEGDVQ